MTLGPDDRIVVRRMMHGDSNAWADTAAADTDAEAPLDSFGDELKRVLDLRGLSQSRAGRRCGLDHSHISRLLSGSRKPMVATVQQLSLKLEATPQETFRLFAAAGYLPPGMPDLWIRLGEMFSEELHVPA
jgi:hypothetical protein